MEKNLIKRIIILGHSGFIGSHLMEGLATLIPDVELIGRSFPDIDLRKSGSAKTLLPFLGSQTAVIMLSAIKRQFGDTLESLEQNMAMCVNLAQLLETRPIARLIFFSSMAVYGEDIDNTQITENTAICLRSYYGIAKYFGELIFEKVFYSQGGSLVILRPPLIYGPGDQGNTYGPAGFLDAVRNNRTITLWGDGDELREFIYVEDVVRIVASLLGTDHQGVVNIAAGKSYSFQNIIRILESFFPGVVCVATRPRTKGKVNNGCDNRKLREWIGGFQFTVLEDGVRKMCEAGKALKGVNE